MEIPEIREQGILSGILILALSVGHLSQEEKSILCCLLHKHMSYQLPRGESTRLCVIGAVSPPPSVLGGESTSVHAGNPKRGEEVT